jgi:hypothetical protein
MKAIFEQTEPVDARRQKTREKIRTLLYTWLYRDFVSDYTIVRSNNTIPLCGISQRVAIQSVVIWSPDGRYQRNVNSITPGIFQTRNNREQVSLERVAARIS